MSEKPSKPRRTSLKRKTGTYPQPPPQEDYSYPDNARPTPGWENYPASEQSQPERIVVVKQSTTSNVGGLAVLYIIAWPFKKVADAVMWLVKTIIAAMIRSVVSFIMWSIILALMVAFAGTYTVAMIDTNMNTMQALSLTLERIMTFIVTLGGLRATAETVKHILPTIVL